jgi:hypothetical protein
MRRRHGVPANTLPLYLMGRPSGGWLRQDLLPRIALIPYRLAGGRGAPYPRRRLKRGAGAVMRNAATGTKAAGLAAVLLVLGAGAAQACQLREEYLARLGPRDHFNSKGVRLTSAAAIIRQDRANFHQFGIRDPEDGGDRFFASLENRARLERMLELGSATPGAISAIVNDTPLIIVRICAGPRGDFIDVLIR